jgi:hypothetical protein
MRVRSTFLAAAVLTGALCSNGAGCSGGGGDDDPVYFGDLHAHSAFSAPDIVGNADPAEFYRIARDEIGLDFVALSDHDVFLTPEEWDEIRATAPLFDAPGTFVAFSAIEWTHQWHMNTIFRLDGETVCDCGQAPDYYAHHRELIEARDAASHVNHPTDIFLPDWSLIDDSLTKNLEVFNASSSDQEHGYGGAIWSLRAGFRFGFVGVSDDHMTDAMPPRIGNGLTGCHARELSREALLDALHERRCYAVTRERILVDTEIAGVAMGGAASASIGDTVTAGVDVTATAQPVEIELVHNGETVASTVCEGPSCRLRTDIRIGDPNNFVYARIKQPDTRPEQAGGEQHAWSSPVWIDATCPATDGDCLAERLAITDEETTDCLAMPLLPAGADPESYPPANAAEPYAIRCRDGDTRCDADDEAGVCTVRIGLCFAVADARLPSCEARRADAFTVVEPATGAPRRSDDWQNRSTLHAIFQAAHTSADKNRCSGISGLRIPAGSEKSFEIATSAAGAVDHDRWTIACAAALAAE